MANFKEFIRALTILTKHDTQHLDLDAKLICFHAIGDTSQISKFPIFLPLDLSDPEQTSKDLQVVFEQLETDNENGFGIYWAVNEFGKDLSIADHFIDEANNDTWKRLSDNVSKIRALFVDVDYYLSTEEINKIITAYSPTLVTLSSTNDGKFKSHFYWIFSEGHYELVNDFSILQKSIAYKLEDFIRNNIVATDGPITDKKVIDPARILRLPGFDHKKKEDFSVKIHHTSDYFPATEDGVSNLLTDIFDLSEDYIEEIRRKDSTNNSVKEFLKNRETTEPIKNVLSNMQEGERNATIYNYALKLFQNGLSLTGTLGAIKEENAEADTPIEDEKEIETTVLSAWKMFERSCSVRQYIRAEEGELGNNPGDIFAKAFKRTLKNKLAEITPQELAKYEQLKKETEEKLEETIGDLYEYDYVDGVEGKAFINFADPLSETAIVERLKQQFGDIIKYDPEIGFIIYNAATGNWEESPKRSENLIANFVTEIAMLAPYEKETIKRAKLYSDGRADLDKISREVGRITNSKSISSCVTKAKQDNWFSCRKDREFNQHKHLINCKNGIVDLRTGKISDHSAHYMMTQQSNFDFNPDTLKHYVDLETKEDWKNSNIWTKFIFEVMKGDIEMCRYLQEIMGYAITGETSEQCCFFFYGNGRNGKSLFHNTIMDVVKDYSAIISSKALAHTEKLDNNVLYALYGLLGARYVKSDEITEKQVWDEALLKSFSGEDYISARPPRGSYIEFKPDYKLFFQGNHKPRITGVDEGAWRRLRIVEWALNLKEGEADKDLGKKFLSAEVGNEILTWLVAGAVRFYAQGEVYTPESVWREVENYRQEIDPFRTWIKECLIVNDDVTDGHCTIEELIECYAVWAKLSDIDTDIKIVPISAITNQSKALKQKQIIGKSLNNHGIKSVVSRDKPTDKISRVYPLVIKSSWLEKIKDNRPKKKLKI